MKYDVTLISDTHALHHRLNLPGGDLLIHSGDFMTSGYSKAQAIEFFDWLNAQPYDNIVFIAGNHDRIMQNNPEKIKGILTGYNEIEYLEDEELVLYNDGPNGEFTSDNIKIYGTPWQPEFYNWAFNLPRNGDELKSKWEQIPTDIDILITHTPAQGYLDTSGYPYNEPNLGCELLRNEMNRINPKIHVCGHIHGGYGYLYNGTTHFFNASVLNEQYIQVNSGWRFNWDTETNEIIFI